MIKGEKVYLTAIEENDLEQLRNWRNLPNFRKHFREYKEISKTMQQNWFEHIVNGDNSAEESCKLLFDYGFHELGLIKIWTELYEFDHKKIESQEGTFPAACGVTNFI